MPVYHVCILLLLLMGCQSKAEKVAAKGEEATVATESDLLVNPEGLTVARRFLVPDGFRRMEQPQNSYGTYLQQFRLKPHGAPVLYFDGSVKPNDGIYEAVLDIDVGKQDLQQCADAIMRLRAEYLFGQKRFQDIHFNFTSGFRADYSKWQQGYRVQVKGNDCRWVKKAAPATSYTSFKDYLKVVFTYAGTLSLEKEMQAISVDDLQAGDVFIKGGSPGHAVTVMDVAVNTATGEKLFLLAQSYMPAQEIHILKNPTDPSISPWYSSTFGKQIFTPEWTFQRNQLRRFNNL